MSTLKQATFQALLDRVNTLKADVFTAREPGDDEMRRVQGLLAEVRDLIQEAIKKLEPNFLNWVRTDNPDEEYKAEGTELCISHCPSEPVGQFSVTEAFDATLFEGTLEECMEWADKNRTRYRTSAG